MRILIYFSFVLLSFLLIIFSLVLVYGLMSDMNMPILIKEKPYVQEVKTEYTHKTIVENPVTSYVGNGSLICIVGGDGVKTCWKE